LFKGVGSTTNQFDLSKQCFATAIASENLANLVAFLMILNHREQLQRSKLQLHVGRFHVNPQKIQVFVADKKSQVCDDTVPF